MGEKEGKEAGVDGGGSERQGLSSGDLRRRAPVVWNEPDVDRVS